LGGCTLIPASKVVARLTEQQRPARQYLDRRIPDRQTLRREVEAWEQQRNGAVVKVQWQFTTTDAREQLRKLDPTIELQ
jgi:hypothetical protein